MSKNTLTHKDKCSGKCPRCGFEIFQTALEQRVLSVLQMADPKGEHIKVGTNGHTRLVAEKRIVTTELGDQILRTIPMYYEHIAEGKEHVCSYKINLNDVLKIMGLHKEFAPAYSR